MTSKEYQAKYGKGAASASTKPSKPKAKVKPESIQEPEESPYTLPDISESPSEVALKCLKAHSKYVEYGPDYLIFTAPDGKKYRATVKEEKS